MRDGRETITYVTVVPVQQPWEGGKPWNLALRDAVHEAARMFLESLSGDMK